MNKKIIVFTPHYKYSPNEKISTLVVNQFVNLMVSKGNNVDVRRIVSKSFFWDFFKKKLIKLFNSKFGGFSSEIIPHHSDIILTEYLPFANINPFFNKSKINQLKIDQKYDLGIFFWYYPSIYFFRNKSITSNIKKSILVVHEIFPRFDFIDLNKIKINKILFRSEFIRSNWNKLKYESDILPSPVDLQFENFEHNKTKDILIISKLIDRKNIIETLDIILLNTNLSITLIGDGPLKQKIIDTFSLEINNGRLIYKGFIHSKKLILKEYSNHRYFVLISHLEAFGLVYVEAILNNCIVFCHSSSGIATFLEDGYSGFLLENIKNLPSKLNVASSLSDKKKKIITENAKTVIKKKLDPDFVNKTLIDE